MKLALICSRGYDNYAEFKILINQVIQMYNIKEFVSGGAKGADKFAEILAEEWNFPIKVFHAEWEKYG